MNKQARSYLEMQLEEPRLDSGRYRVADQDEAAEDGNPMLDGFKRAAISLGLDFGQPAGAGERFEIHQNKAGY